ncbi:TPA: DUF2274 domain-containing protein [Pseudomonas aeruginosa]|nr:DUF2274 domain-containing protein [Pseudomonas aeruginosa]
MACKPLSAMMLSSLRAGPVGWVSPCCCFESVTLIPYMLEVFMAGDRGFRKRSTRIVASRKPC